MLVKTGPDVRVSVRRALGGTDLGQLREVVEREFLTLNEHEKNMCSVTKEDQVMRQEQEDDDE